MYVHHIGIDVHDIERSIAFYRNLFDATLVNRISLNGEELVFLQIDAMQIELVSSQTKKEEEPCSSSIHLAFRTETFELDLARFSRHHVPVEEGPYTLENGWNVVYFRGINNELIELLEMPSTSSHASPQTTPLASDRSHEASRTHSIDAF
ncbi:VOC family protein [Shouchella sp. JSM 1781072]|uniref:VOC family protein n=1 Tax=Shouchella sp. JSM 1781072 TaxID=3344581 RepID=UPI0035BFABBF